MLWHFVFSVQLGSQPKLPIFGHDSARELKPPTDIALYIVDPTLYRETFRIASNTGP